MRQRSMWKWVLIGAAVVVLLVILAVSCAALTPMSPSL